METERLMLEEGMAHEPQNIVNYFVKQLDEGNQKYRGHPALRTIKRSMADIHRGKVTQYEKRKEFHYPSGIGDGRNQIPRRYAEYAGDCLKLYRKFHDVYPSIGLTQRFVDVAIFTQEPEGFGDIQRALFAEKFWYADLIEAIPDRERPDTTYEDLYIEKHAWVQREPAEVYLGAKSLVIPRKDFRFLLWLPFFDSDLDSELYGTDRKGSIFYGTGITRETMQEEREIFPDAKPSLEDRSVDTKELIKKMLDEKGLYNPEYSDPPTEELTQEARNLDSFTKKWRKVTEEIMGKDLS